MKKLTASILHKKIDLPPERGKFTHNRKFQNHKFTRKHSGQLAFFFFFFNQDANFEEPINQHMTHVTIPRSALNPRTKNHKFNEKPNKRSQIYWKDSEKVYTLVVFSGSKIPAVVFEGGTIFSTKILLKAGIKRFAIAKSFRVETDDKRKNPRFCFRPRGFARV